MRSKRGLKKISEFISHKGEYSSGRLISLVGSFIVFGVFVYDYKNQGIQDLVMMVLGYAFGATTISKFSKYGQDNDQQNPITPSDYPRRSRSNLR